jgi:hypothetical protein
MHTHILRNALVAAALALTLVVSAEAQQIIRQVIGSGATAAIGPQHAIAGTIGQTIIGPVASSSHRAWLGFWYVYPNPNNPLAIREEFSAVTGAAAVRVAPNPVVDVATISVTLPSSGRVTLALYDGLGQQRVELIDGHREAGTITVQLPSRDLESGDYLLVLITGGTRSASPLRVIK